MPILVAFEVQRQHIPTGTLGDKSPGEQAAHAAQKQDALVEASGQQLRKLACIFKVGDDVRQDVLALQVGCALCTLILML